MTPRIIPALALLFASATFGAAPFCDTRSEVRNFAIDSVVEYPFQGSKATAIKASDIIKHSSLESVSALSKGQDFEFLSAFSTSCYWVEQKAVFKKLSASEAQAKWSSRDSSVWIRYIDNMTVGTAEEWIYFRTDTVGWKTASIYSNSYLVAKPAPTQWYAFATRIDTTITSQGTQISISNIASSAIDSATTADGLLDTWAANENQTDHKYGYYMQVFKVVYALKEDPTPLKFFAQPSTPVTLQRVGLRVFLQVSKIGPTWGTLRDSQGRLLQRIQLQPGKQEFLLPEQGHYYFQLENGTGLLIP